MTKKRKETTKSDPVLVTLVKKQEGVAADATNAIINDTEADEEDHEPQHPRPQAAVGLGGTPAANGLASTQLDSDDEDYVEQKSGLKKSNAHNNNYSKHHAAMRRERKRLYELQEAKRRMRKEEGRSKALNDVGETPLLQKVKRLKTERKAVYDEYSSYSQGGSMKKNKKKQKKKRSQGIPLPQSS